MNDLRVVHKNVGAASSCPQGKSICAIHRGEKGITLIALIVTIIVLLILAMTSVSLVLRENLIEKAKTARNEYQMAAQTESDQLDELENAVNSIIDTSGGEDNSGEATPEDIVALCTEYVLRKMDNDNEGAQQKKNELLKHGADIDSIIYFKDETYNYYYWFNDKKILMTTGDTGFELIDSTDKPIEIFNELYEIAGEFDKLFADGEENYYRSIEYKDNIIETWQAAEYVDMRDPYRGYTLYTATNGTNTRFIGIDNIFANSF